jgi:hypothetical protein
MKMIPTNNKKTIFIAILLSQIFIGFTPIIHNAIALEQPTAMDMLMEVDEYSQEASQYTYSDYVGLMEELGIIPSDFILGENPDTVVLASYQKGNIYLWQEVLEFDTSEQAQNEYDLQAEDEEYISGLGYQGNNGPIYQRFVPRERVFVYDRFLFLFFYSPLDNSEAFDEMGRLLPSFISHILETIGTHPPDPPIVSVDAVWGIKPGDVISWHVGGTTFTGSLGTGTSHSQEDWEGSWEIADIQNGHALVKQKSRIEYVLTEDETRVRVDVPYDKYVWLTIDEDGLSLASGDGSSAGIVVFPLILNGIYLSDLVYSSIDHLPERDYSDNEEYLSVHGSTSQYSGFTPIETQWKDITVHKGTGIVTSSEFYYNNNEYSITTATDIVLVETNFPLNSRSPIKRSLKATTSFSSSKVVEGTPLTITASVTDQDDEPISDANVTVIFNDQTFSLSSHDSGRYEVTLNTVDIEAGTFDIILSAEKSGYQKATETSSIVVEEKDTGKSSSTDSEKGGIPGFPTISIAMGVALAFFVASRMRYGTH